MYFTVKRITTNIYMGLNTWYIVHGMPKSAQTRHASAKIWPC